MNLDDTIAALATPPGEGGIGIIRISGPDAFPVALRLFRSPSGKSRSDIPSHQVLYGFIVDPDTSETVDEVLLIPMKAPRSYTCQDVVEISCHGGMAPLRRVFGLLLGEGVRPAEPGEFTQRAFLNGRIDLTRAEAVLDVINSRTELA
ncbi:MAG: tRNA uridine-5-carboxymethylaminomethyl(34) synthesis GTPase MnmE, partial [Nitrospirota bacterium]|nr:tRNA uridine-5-carboxymethylaminomethyl(34) synthesis GTPase MnmE [Nitrospirota bacterium]